MRRGGAILGNFLEDIAQRIKPGIDVYSLEEHFINLCKREKVFPSCKGYTANGFLPPFPTGLCVSINSQSVHCYPTKGRILLEGDIITVDTVIFYKGLHVDAAFAKCVGQVTPNKAKLVQTSKQALKETESIVRAGIRTGDLGNKMYSYVSSQGFNVLRDYAGHGIGEDMHEDPEVPCFGKPNTGFALEEDMTICIETLTTEGNPQVRSLNEWETKMSDGKCFCQFEHTVLVTEDGFDILTPFEV